MTRPRTAATRAFLQKCAVLFSGAPWMLSGAQAQMPTPPAPVHVGSHLCGGVGDSSLTQLQSRATDYNLGFWMVGGPSGAYLADVPIEIRSGRQTVASFTADGPLCYVKLPGGRYTVTGTHNGQTRSVQVQSGSMNNYLRW